MVSFDNAQGQVSRLIHLESTPSTNSELTARASGTDLPDFCTLITTDQTAGRGRLDRVWSAPAGTALAISVLIRTASDQPAPRSSWGWLPLAAGVAMVAAVSDVLPHSEVGVKWPNDVLVKGRKISGILAEVTPAGVVVGAGLNVTMSAEQLPVSTATSLVLEGADPSDLFDRVLAAYLHRLTGLVTDLRASGGDADRSGLRPAAIEACSTLGRSVRVELPGGSTLLGRAVGIDHVGRLEVRAESGRVEAVAAGDIVHLR